MQFVDTHCHIQFNDYPHDFDAVLARSYAAGVGHVVLVGCSLEDSQLAVQRASKTSLASIGLHPHEASRYVDDKPALDTFAALAGSKNVSAIGEIGLDYYYNHSGSADQKKLLRFQLDLAKKNNLPVIFHVREAFDDFWPIYDDYKLPGVIHSFSAGVQELEQILTRGLYVGVNGIATFSKNPDQLEAFRRIPLQNLLLETDAPFLTPKPYRGTVCEPKHVLVTAEFLSDLRGQSVEQIAAATSKNAAKLFNIDL